MLTIKKLDSLAEKEAFWALLLLADPEAHAVHKYLESGEMYVLFADGMPVSEAVMHERPDGQIELKNLATDPAHQGKGYAGHLIAHLFEAYRGRYEAMYVGTAFPGLYERWGFEYAYTAPNFFIDNYAQPVIDEGRQCVDMIYYRRILT